MAEFIFDLVDDWGIWGILLSLFIEGSAFPFVGTFFIVTVGFIMDLDWVEIGLISVAGSFLYALGSYIPYYIGYTLGNAVENRLKPARKEQLAKMKASFTKHGVWSVAIASPLHLGNVVPFVAGMARMNIGLYTLLTMIGIAPTTYLFLSIGQFYAGDSETVVKIIERYQLWVLTGLVVVVGLYIWVRVLYKKKRTEKNRSDHQSG